MYIKTAKEKLVYVICEIRVKTRALKKYFRWKKN